MNPAIAKKNEQLKAVTGFQEHDGYKMLETELKRRRDAGIENACNVTFSQTERDAGAGIKKCCEELLQFFPGMQRSLESTLKKRRG